MALWQYTFHILPRHNQLAILPLKKSEDGFDDTLFWIDSQITSSFFEEIGHILLRGRSWSNSIILYGEQGSNCFEVYADNDIVESVSFRIDYTSDYESILNRILEFCILNGLIIVDEELNIAPLTYIEINAMIKNSPQYLQYKKLSEL